MKVLFVSQSPNPIHGKEPIMENINIIETENGAIRSCKILHQADLEEML